MKKTFWIYLFIIIIMCTTMTFSGFDVLTVRYWIAIACVIGVFQCGRFDERK